METFNRICIRNYTVRDKAGTTFTVKRGKEYLTSREEKGMVTVFSQYWVPMPVEVFAGEQQFT